MNSTCWYYTLLRQNKFALIKNTQLQNVYNLHNWVNENPYATRTHVSQCNFTLNRRAGIVGNCLLGTYIFLERLYGCIYLPFLQEVLAHMLNDIPMPLHWPIRFQHDRVLVHFSRQVRTHLQANFPGYWIGRGGPIAWPPQPPDLSPIYFFSCFF